ncbi:glycosyltransferase [Croceiramulus getboli]|nr:glycosyltransferase [Flavobacteriaceae bacterium YJPT1-3]
MNQPELLFILTYAVILLINLAFYGYMLRLVFHKPVTPPFSKHQPVSIILCAKNEVENLRQHLPLLLEQRHPQFEIVLINDASSDGSGALMDEFASRNEQIQVVHVENNEAFWTSKKYALTLGIKRAKYDHLLFTDADCRPNSEQWLEAMTRPLASPDNDLVLGYGGYESRPGLLNALIRYETLLTAAQYLGYALHGNAYMGVGRNLAYKASLFYKHNGFVDHIKVAAGDDDLFVNQATNASNTAVVIAPEAFTYSKPKTTWKSWILQKRRHIGVAGHYAIKHKLSLGLFFVTQWLSVFGWILLLLCSDQPLLILGLVGVRYLVVMLVLGAMAKKLKENALIPLIPIYEWLIICMQWFIFIKNIIHKPVRWK